jgi:hypothetical protein
MMSVILARISNAGGPNIIKSNHHNNQRSQPVRIAKATLICRKAFLCGSVAGRGVFGEWIQNMPPRGGEAGGGVSVSIVCWSITLGVMHAG